MFGLRFFCPFKSKSSSKFVSRIRLPIRSANNVTEADTKNWMETLLSCQQSPAILERDYWFSIFLWTKILLYNQTTYVRWQHLAHDIRLVEICCATWGTGFISLHFSTSKTFIRTGMHSSAVVSSVPIVRIPSNSNIARFASGEIRASSRNPSSARCAD